MNTPMSLKFWQHRRGRIRTQAGQWLAGRDAIFRKHSLLHDLIHRLTETQLMVYGISGRIVSKELSLWLEKAYFMTSYPDSRLWCNSITSMAASPKTSPVGAIVAGFLAADSKAYGSYATFRAAESHKELYSQYQEGEGLVEMLQKRAKGGRPPNLPGFLRPVHVQDERLEPIRKVTKDLGFLPGSYLQFAEEISCILSKNYGTAINAAGYYAAFLLDQQFTPQQIYLMCIRCTECGLLACYQQHVDELEMSFLPLQCDDITYSGQSLRSVPARQSKSC